MSEARIIVRLCERFSCLPSALLEEDVAFIRMVTMVDRWGEEMTGDAE